MSDDEWRGDERDRRDPRDLDESAEFGGPLFPDEPPEEEGGPGNGSTDTSATSGRWRCQ